MEQNNIALSLLQPECNALTWSDWQKVKKYWKIWRAQPGQFLKEAFMMNFMKVMIDGQIWRAPERDNNNFYYDHDKGSVIGSPWIPEMERWKAFGILDWKEASEDCRCLLQGGVGGEWGQPQLSRDDDHDHIIQDLEHKMPKPCENTTEFNYTPVSTTWHRCTNSTGDDNDMDQEVKPNWSPGAHVERGGNLAREGGGREQGDWKTWPKYKLVVYN